MISPQEFWARVEASGILPPERLAAIKRQVASKPEIAASARRIAKVLIANHVLTHEQAQAIFVDGQQEDELPAISAQASAQSSHVRPTSRAPWLALTTCGILGAVLTVFLAWPYISGSDDSRSATQGESAQAANTASHDLDTHSEDANLLWMRPAPSVPFDLKFLPPDTQMVVRIRMDQLRSDEGDLILQSVGPHLTTRLEEWLARLGLTRDDLRVLWLFLLPQGSTQPLLVVRGELAGQATACLSSLGQPNAESLIPLATQGVWLPPSAPHDFLYGPLDVLRALRDSPPNPLRRELRILHEATHETDTLSILANPNFLRDEAQGLFAGTRRRLLNGLFAFWSDEAQAVSLSLQQHQLAFLEIRLMARQDVPPQVLAAHVRAYFAELPTQISSFLGAADLDTYWQRLALRFPQMVSAILEHTRVVVEHNQVAMTTIAPPEATHNLLLASELGLATSVSVDVAPSIDRSRWTVQDVLDSPLDFRFAQMSLDQAAQAIAQQVREELSGLPFTFEIRIVGEDLEPEGITRNQQIRGFEAQAQSLREILTQLVAQANPVPGVESVQSVDQKLVWIESSQTLGEILISTRSAVAAQGRELPPEFQP